MTYRKSRRFNCTLHVKINHIEFEDKFLIRTKARPAVTFPAKEFHRPSISTKLCCLVTEAHRCEQLAQGCYAALSRLKLNPQPIDLKSNASEYE